MDESHGDPDLPKSGKNTQNSDLRYDVRYIFLLLGKSCPPFCKKFETNRAIRCGETIFQTFQKSYYIVPNQFQEEIDYCLLNIANLTILLRHTQLSDLQNLFFIWKPVQSIYTLFDNVFVSRLYQGKFL